MTIQESMMFRAGYVGGAARLAVPLLAVACALGVTASTAGAAPNKTGIAPLLVLNPAGRQVTSTDRHLRFRLPPGAWRAERNYRGQIVRDGTYVRRSTVKGRRCVISLGVGGRGQRSRPALRTINGSRQVRRGTTGAVRWLAAVSVLPPVLAAPYAKAYSAAPSWATWNWSVFYLSAQAQSPTTSPCRRSLLHLDLAPVAASVRVARGALPPG